MNFLKQNWIKVGLGMLILGVVFVVYSEVFYFKKPKIAAIPLKRDCSQLVPKNPYSHGGEYTGFEWSMVDRGSRNCEAYNEPFIIGCMEHVKQEESYNKCIGVKETQEVKPVLLKNCSNEIAGYCMDGL